MLTPLYLIDGAKLQSALAADRTMADRERHHLLTPLPSAER
jgi:hypothetical protein